MRLFLIVCCFVFFVRPLGGEASCILQSCTVVEGNRRRIGGELGEEFVGELFDVAFASFDLDDA